MTDSPSSTANDSRPPKQTAYDERVAKGMALLDEKIPGWEARINVRRLQLSDCGLCVVGQIFRKAPALLGDEPVADYGDGDGDADFYEGGLNRLIGDEPDESGKWPDPAPYGFTLDSHGGVISWHTLTQAWKRAIRARLAAAQATERASS